ncbi:hypothetical protein HanIR_Chr11g0516731 [Helianthus annuus]|nr:hypothetical protein HanIR_Chr11g0516731 [Helianthus annuus]
MLIMKPYESVVTREAICNKPVDNSYETSLVSWVLPYAQRYISNSYRERYLQLKLAGFEKVNRLQIVVVEKLYYKNVIKRSKLVSKKRHDCICLLQDAYAMLAVMEIKLGGLETSHLILSCRNNLFVFEILCL